MSAATNFITDRGLKHKDIWPVLGNKGATTEILNGRRSFAAVSERVDLMAALADTAWWAMGTLPAYLPRREASRRDHLPERC